MTSFKKIVIASLAVVGLVAGSLDTVGVPAADALSLRTTKDNDPNYNTPGFPLPEISSDKDTPKLNIIPVANNDTPALIQPLNDGGFRTDAPHAVNIGDSFTTSAFYGTTVMEPCVHNAIGFGYMLGKQTGLPLRDAACAGGNIKHYWHTGNSFIFPIPKRAQRLTIDRNSKLVVVSLGGNNVYSDAQLIELLGCAAEWFKPGASPDSNPCQQKLGPDMARRIKGLLPALTYMYQDAQERAAKDAVVIAMGYFNLIPDDSTNCALSAVAPKEDLAFINRIFGLLNRQIRKAAKAAGVLYYNPAAEKAAVDASCGAPFMRMLTLTGIPEANVPLHPTLPGHWVMAKGVADLYKRELAARKRGTTIAPSTWRLSKTERHFLRSIRFALLDDWRQGPLVLDQMTPQEYHAKYWNAPNHDELDKQIAREHRAAAHRS